jgi:hypothetical protein
MRDFRDKGRRMSRSGTRQGEAADPLFHSLEIKSMFKKLVPVIALALIAGPVFAADPAPASTDQAPAKSSSHKHHSKSKSSKHSKSASSDSTAPAK